MRTIVSNSIFILLTFFLASTAFAEAADIKNSYAVVWAANTSDKELYNKTIPAQTAHLLKLWQAGTVENVYMNNKDADKKMNLGDRGKVIFFIKAKTEADAKKVLNEMPFVKEKVAKYTLFPVGVLWLKQP
jgi:hypothetical protein